MSAIAFSTLGDNANKLRSLFLNQTGSGGHRHGFLDRKGRKGRQGYQRLSLTSAFLKLDVDFMWVRGRELSPSLDGQQDAFGHTQDWANIAVDFATCSEPS